MGLFLPDRDTITCVLTLDELLMELFLPDRDTLTCVLTLMNY